MRGKQFDAVCCESSTPSRPPSSSIWDVVPHHRGAGLFSWQPSAVSCETPRVSLSTCAWQVCASRGWPLPPPCANDAGSKQGPSSGGGTPARWLPPYPPLFPLQVQAHSRCASDQFHDWPAKSSSCSCGCFRQYLPAMSMPWMPGTRARLARSPC